jgi:hypothetical protein
VEKAPHWPFSSPVKDEEYAVTSQSDMQTITLLIETTANYQLGLTIYCVDNPNFYCYRKQLVY